ncbi:uncharacterized protein LOC128128114 [Lactuca sativa]|uniref:uncharacterized protein LOC122195655 n=1 Tax=Lactuca sativa TaxID=4236 RepID=UPI001C691671|nr:uncharacterized protein LOC122195655 [Lactuca sativa]XP_052621446.1 uncharacterized protein LOC128127118 [Lactuca sativa]XP_052622895.1 uncharacterized protein LOC128128114 [Lactuca sativa]
MSENRSDPISSNSQSSSSSIIEVSNPLFLASSDNPSTILVSKVFDGTGFASWKRSMTLALSAKNKIGFVDGTIQKPDENSNQFETWNRVNSMVISWLLNSLSKDIAESVLFLQTACDIWNEINQRYQQANGALVYQIQKKLFSTTQGSEDFSSYFTKMKKIWDELNMIQEVPACTCGSTAKIKKYIEEQRLIQLLMGLNESYKSTRGQILMMNPLPSIATVHSLLIHEERQRDINSIPNIIADSMAMNVNHQTSNSNNSFNKKNLQCTHCKKSGHVKATCYRINGFPSDFKFTKSKRQDSTVQNVIDNSTPGGGSSSVDKASIENSTISTQQYQQLMQLMSNLSNNFNKSVNSVITNGAMDSSGPFVEE